MSGMPWLSIIVPAYNAEKYLDDCITSIDPKCHLEVEIILVDDGSTDSTPQICDRLAGEHENLKVIHRENGGSPSARNTGCVRAEGDWVWFVDSDDVIAPYALDVLRGACSSTDADAVRIRFLEFTDCEKLVWPASMPSENRVALTSGEFLSGIYGGKYGHHMWSFLLRTDVLLGRNEHIVSERDRNEHRGWPFPEDFSLYEDVVAAEELVRRMRCIDVMLLVAYGYRQVGFSMTHKKSDKAADSGLRAVRELQKYDVPTELTADKARMELGLLFSAYKLIEDGAESMSLKRCFDTEIRRRAKALGLFGMGAKRFVRYVLYRTGAMDLIIGWRLRRG